jgi:hypothetical protein
MEYSATLIRGFLAMAGLAGKPQLARRCSSTRSTPHTILLISLSEGGGCHPGYTSSEKKRRGGVTRVTPAVRGRGGRRSSRRRRRRRRSMSSSNRRMKRSLRKRRRIFLREVLGRHRV